MIKNNVEKERNRYKTKTTGASLVSFLRYSFVEACKVFMSHLIRYFCKMLSAWFIRGVCFVIEISRLSFFWYLGKAMLRIYVISWVSSLMFLFGSEFCQ